MKKIKLWMIIGCIMCVMGIFIWYPFTCTELHLKIYFSEDSAFTQCSLYYTTEDMPDFNNENMIPAVGTGTYADIVFPRELCGRLQNIRLDFSEAQNLIGISRVELCSGGFIQKSYEGPEFFKESNILQMNDIQVLSNTPNVAYVGTAGDDPFFIFQQPVTAAFHDAFSHYTITKLFICIFIAGTIVMMQKKLFTEQ